MKRLLLVAALAALLVPSPGCSKSKSDGTQHTSADSSSRQETAWKAGAETADAAPAEVRASPHPEPPPSGLPMTADGSEGGGAGRHTDLKAPPAVAATPGKAAPSKAATASKAATPRSAKAAAKPPAAFSPQAAESHSTEAASSASPPISLHDPRGLPAAGDPPAAADPPSATPSASAPRTLRERLASGLTNSAASAIDPRGFATVRVYYGTNRQEFFPTVDWHRYARHFRWPAALAGITALLLALRWAGFRRGALRAATLIGVMGTLTWLSFSGYRALREYQTSTRPGHHYGGDRGQLELGTCDVTIPANHEIGEIEKPSILRLEFREDVTKHVTLQSVEEVDPNGFYEQLQERVGCSPRKDAFVFVHGFNVSFDEAAKRTAQIAYDLSFEGAPIFFSWPSQGSPLEYAVDKENAEWAADDIGDFLIEVAKNSGAQQIHLIAHSMGNRALTYALRNMYVARQDGRTANENQQASTDQKRASTRKRLKQKFNQIVLTAPDIDADIFKTQIVPAVTSLANRVTLYASSHDKALDWSKKFNGHPRAGDSGAGLVVVKGIDTIDVSAVDTSLVGHSYYGSSDTVLSDIWALIKCAKSPDMRDYLRPRDYTGGLKYWVFEPTATAAAESGENGLRR